MFLSLLLVLACSTNEETAATPEGAPHADRAETRPAPADLQKSNDTPTSVAGMPEQVTPSGLKSWVLKEGTGATPQAGQTVEVHYTGWLKDGGTKFDSSVDRGEVFTFPLGQGRVIPGWDEGVALMKVGEKRQFEIPANLAYGDRGAGGVIPPGATLIFDVELIGIK